jgi:hypothetical protein
MRNGAPTSTPEPKQQQRVRTYKTQDRSDDTQQKLLQQKKQLANTEVNFPALGNTAPSPKTWTGDRSFATLANEWKAHTDEENEQIERQKLHEIRTSTNIVVPRFNRTVRNFESYDEHQVDEPALISPLTDEWKIVDRKTHVPRDKSIQEMEADDRAKERARAEDQFSVWDDNGNLAEHETYWDERRY